MEPIEIGTLVSFIYSYPEYGIVLNYEKLIRFDDIRLGYSFRYEIFMFKERKVKFINNKWLVVIS